MPAQRGHLCGGRHAEERQRPDHRGGHLAVEGRPGPLASLQPHRQPHHRGTAHPRHNAQTQIGNLFQMFGHLGSSLANCFLFFFLPQHQIISLLPSFSFHPAFLFFLVILFFALVYLSIYLSLSLSLSLLHVHSSLSFSPHPPLSRSPLDGSSEW